MTGNLLINDIFSGFQRTLNTEQELREIIRTTCRDVDQISREITTALQIIHHNEEGIAPACLKARELFEKAREGYKKLKEAVPSTDYFKYYDHWRMMTQRYCFLISLTIWLEAGILATHQTVAEVLGISAVEQKEGFHLDIEDYLVGLLHLCSELSRLAVNSVTRGEYSRPVQISKFVMELNAGFRSDSEAETVVPTKEVSKLKGKKPTSPAGTSSSTASKRKAESTPRLLNLKNDHLRKRFDGLKYDVKKIEEVVYDLSIRGMLNDGRNGDDAKNN